MQRVSIGRAIVRKPRVFLMDEPLSALDAKLREALRTELKNLQMNLGATFLFVTHDQIEAMSMGDKIGVLNHGRLVQTGTPNEIYNNPREHLRRQLGRLAADEPARRQRSSNGRAVVPAPMTSSCLTPARPRAAGDGRPLTFGIRPEDVYLEAGAPVEAKVHDVENHGVEKILTLRVGDAMLRATVPARPTSPSRRPSALPGTRSKVVLFDQAKRRQPQARVLRPRTRTRSGST